MMDGNDLQILDCLRDNARVKATDLAKVVGMSVSAVIERIHRLEESGLIQGYTAVLDQKKLGNDVVALMDVSLEHPRYFDSFTAMVCSHPNIVSCYYLTGEFDFTLKIITDTSDHLEAIHRTIKSMEGVSATQTHFVLKSIKNDISPLCTNDNF